MARSLQGLDVDRSFIFRRTLSPRDDAFKVVVDEVRLPRLEPRVYTEEQFNALTAASPKFNEVLGKEGVVLFEAHGE